MLDTAHDQPTITSPFKGEAMVVGLARNCSTTIEDAVNQLKSALPPFCRVHWFIVESDSDDETANLLTRLRDKLENFNFVSLGHLRHRLPKRTERIAVCRNTYLDEVRAQMFRGDLRYVLVADLDGVNPILNRAALESCWSRSDWDVCSANQAGPYYDIWALRHPVWCPDDYQHELKFLRRYGRSLRSAAFAAIYAKMVTIPPDSDWIEVESAFGGLALYRAAVLVSASYVGLRPDGTEICEHVSLHEQIRSAGGRIFINPAMLNAGLTEHSKYWEERLAIASETNGLFFRAITRLFFRKNERAAFRHMLDSAS